ncbi:dolichyl-diphosphooligosaccharide-protein glycosyltransferase [Fonticula alba]|uniref:dolichyl-diphosphooligosaccharide--protein glycotransferase n=1 Tax=Fonticula alba TaxID=691883 RepID=A0A058Z4X5_FONAL|nr:dolichyl-diphosphooligosaccharide-protein glycosyltransferase [Fonticula alba]KCV68953.1 dolichyl-diphosphooligosaccharide-protein glycosyltransferase [Fonticula alba]|eukprot:XP_009496524.1 dolichyl-diphosphooligosaccharide-protein glycosyltransferase [Fonticula alba]
MSTSTMEQKPAAAAATLPDEASAALQRQKEQAQRSRLFVMRLVILGLIWLVAFGSRLFSVVRFESIIHEFDPWFNYRATRMLVNSSLDDFLNWFDHLAWYPLGRAVGGTVYPGLMLVSASIYRVLQAVNIPMDIRHICVFLAPVFSGATAVSTYLFTRELKDERAGLFAAAFIALAPGYSSRSVAGSYDNEAVAIFALQLTFFLWLRAQRTGSTLWSLACVASYWFMVASWGGYVFITNLIPLHVLAMVLLGRFNSRLHTAYSIFYVFGTLASMTVPFVNFQPVKTSEHMAALGMFVLLQGVAGLYTLRRLMSPAAFRRLLVAGGLAALVAGASALYVLRDTDLIRPWAGRFYSLWDTNYARVHLPIVASVSEHQPTTWTSFFFDLNLMTVFFPVGLFLCFRRFGDAHVFAILNGLTAVYFSAVMVRLVLTLAPIACVLSGYAVSHLLDYYLGGVFGPADSPAGTGHPPAVGTPVPAAAAAAEASATPTTEPTPTKAATIPAAAPAAGSPPGTLGLIDRVSVLLPLVLVLVVLHLHCIFVTSTSYSNPSVVLSASLGDSRMIIDDFRESYSWLRHNTPQDARIMSWWDYGYQISGFSNRTVLVDNNTWNNTHIATVGKAFAMDEANAFDVMVQNDVDYVLVVFGGLLGYSGDDINKFLWMVRIAQGVYPGDVTERAFFNSRGQFKVDETASPTMYNSLMFKLSYHRFYSTSVGKDRVRMVAPHSSISRDTPLASVEEVYTSSSWLVRIYRVREPDIFGRTVDERFSDFLPALKPPLAPVESVLPRLALSGAGER